MSKRLFSVSDGSGGYDADFDWVEACEIARQDSQDGKFMVVHTTPYNVHAIYHDGELFIPANGQTCDNCGKPLSIDASRMSYDLTSSFFCSSDCGVALGVLVNRGGEER